MSRTPGTVETSEGWNPQEAESEILMSGTLTPLLALEAVLRTEELNRRPARPPDYEKESRALVSLAQALANSPGTILQALADTILEVFQADSAGISLVTADGERFYWPAIAGVWKPHIGGGTLRNFGPCGDVLDRNRPLLFTHFERRYPYLLEAVPPAEECLLVPFYFEQKAVGTIWAITHDERRKFDSEDLRMLVSLSTFASAAYQAVEQVHLFNKQDYQRQDTQALREMNEALLVSSVRQHELAEQAWKAEVSVRDSERLYRTLFDLCPVAVYSCTPSGVIQEFNRRAAQLWDREPAVGDTDQRFCGSFKLFRPDGSFLPHEQCPMAEVLSGKISEVSDAEVIIERSDGSRVIVVVNIRPLKNERGESTGAINCFYDITERSRLERKTHEQADALADLHRRKDEFLAMLSHELRNPLAPISNAVQLLRLQENEDPLQQHARAIIERQVAQLTRLVDDLMEVSRITTGRLQLRQDRVVVESIVERAVETTRPLLDQRRHELTVSLPPQPIWLRADADRLEQVVVNLLTNAAKYTDEGGQIGLTVEQRGDECVLRVRDTGVGIAPELLPRVFDLFTQAKRSLDRSQGGLGIGLALVQRLVEMHGGRVEAFSALGQGSEFVVRLPIERTPEEAQPPSTPKEADGLIGASLRILVVDDNTDSAQSLAMLLKRFRHHVRTADDGPTALEAADQFRPNVVLLDIGLPGMDGYEVAKAMRRQAAFHDVTLIAMTGYGQESDRARSREAGFDHHMVKPADFAKLRQILANVAGRAT